jgi:protein TonB
MISLKQGIAISLFFALAGFTGQAAADDWASGDAHVDHSMPTPAPIYPVAAQVNGEQGDLVMRLHVTSGGRVTKIEVVKSTGYRDLDNAGIDAALGWHYLPAVENGSTASGWATVHLEFSLPKPPAAPNSGT